MKNRIRLIPFLFLLLLVSFTSSPLFIKRGISLFTSEDVLEVTLKGEFFSNHKDFKSLKFKKEHKYVSGTLDYKDSSLALEYKVRGVYRQANCELPPLKLNLKKKALKNDNLLNGAHDKIKLVTHCENYNGDFDPKNRINQKVISEFIAYKLISKIYPYSLKARLLKVSYEDSTFGPATAGFGIFLESKKDLVKRLDLALFNGEKKEFKKEYYKGKESFRISNYVNLALAQSMLNNWDWYPTHNTFLAKDKSNKDILVPYDFDLTGFVYDVIDLELKEKGETHKYWQRRERRHFDFRAFPYQKSINYIRSAYKKRYDFSDKKIIKLFKSQAKTILSKRNEVFNELNKFKDLLTSNNYDSINGRITNYFSQLEVALYNKVSLNYFTDADYLRDLQSESFEKRQQAIIALGYMGKDEYFNNLTSIFYKIENFVLKNSIIKVLPKFNPEIVYPFLSKILKRETKTGNLSNILDVIFRFPLTQKRNELIYSALLRKDIYSNKVLIKKLLKALPKYFKANDKTIRTKLEALKTLIKGNDKTRTYINRTLNNIKRG